MTTLYRVTCGDCDNCTSCAQIRATFAEAQLAWPVDGYIEKLTAGQPVEDVTPVRQDVEQERLVYHTCHREPPHWHRWGGHDWGYSHPWVFIRPSAFENFARFDDVEWSGRSVEYPIT